MKKFVTLLVFVGGLSFCHAQGTIYLTPGQEVTPPTASADGDYGSAFISLTGNVLNVTDGYYATTGPATLITVSEAPAGMNGPTIFDLTIDPDYVFGIGTFSGSNVLTAPEITALENGDIYINVETAANPSGEIRGQILAGVVPEPATMTLMAAGSLSWLAMRRRKI
jgi:hypothetical protein